MSEPILAPCGLFWTPQTVEELDEFVQRFTGSEASVVALAVGVTWNCCAKLVADEMEKKS